MDRAPDAAAPEREPFLDMLKAASIVAVVAWHVRPLVLRCGQQPGCGGLSIALDLIQFHVLLLAVPLFFLLSLILLLRRLESGGESYLRRRILRLGFLYVFWTTVQFALARWLGSGDAVSWKTLLAGGPRLPVVGASVFYFLSCLLVLSLLTGILHGIATRSRRAALATSLVLSALFVVLFEYDLWSQDLSVDSTDVTGFLPLVPLAYCLNRYGPALRRRLLPLLALCWSACVIQETMVLLTPEHGISYYARPSVLFGLALLYVPAAALRAGGGPLAGFLSRHSLGIFALHKYVHLLFAPLRAHHWPLPLYAALNLAPLAEFALVLGVTALAVFILARTPLRRTVT